MLAHSETKAFEDRGIDPEVADRLGCRFENGRFVFEYRDMDEIVARKIRPLEKKFWFEPSMPRLLWNVDSLRGLGSKPRYPLVITEGEFDTIAVYQACGGYVVSVPNGANGQKSETNVNPLTDGGFRFLWDDNGKLIPEVEQFDKFILATDDDEKGHILRDELAIRLGPERCWFITYLAGCKDANDILRDHGPEALARVIQNAKPMRPSHLVRPCDLPPRQANMAYSTGWGFLDRHMMLVRPELMVVTGQPGHGKSIWIRSLTYHLAEAHGWKIAYLTPEDPAERLKRDMKRFAARPGAFHRNNPNWVDEHFLISQPPEDDPITMDVVEAEMAAAALHHDCQVFVIDPWNEISHDRGRRTDTEYVEQALVTLKRKARRYGLLLIIAAHPRKIEEGREATLYDISGSSNWRNKADHGVIVHRSAPDSDDVKLIIEKCKDHETMGIPGERWLKFEKSKCDFVEGDGE